MTAAEPASLKVMGKATGTLSNGIGSNTVNEWLDWQEMAIAVTSLMLRDTGNASGYIDTGVSCRHFFSVK